MTSIKRMNHTDLAGFVGAHLSRNQIHVVLSGGACVEYYSDGAYVSNDYDFIDIAITKLKRLKEVMVEIGFEEENRYFKHPDTHYFIEFPPGPLSIGSEPIKDIQTVTTKTGAFRIISPTDCVKDRLAAFYHWEDLQSLEQAVLVAQGNKIDLDEVQRWSVVEGKEDEFKTIRARLSP